jgi:glucose/arabinose dehydrogenase
MRLALARTLATGLALAPLATQDAPAATRRALPRHLAMDYGPCLAATIGVPGGKENIALKGLAVRLDDRHGVLFDTELLRVAAIWSGGFLELLGTTFDESHGPFPLVDGEPWLTTPQLPGVSSDLGPRFAASGGYGAWQDPRPLPHGPLPKSIGRYRGHHLHGRDVVVAYTIGAREVLESWRLQPAAGGTRAVVRAFDVGPAAAASWIRLADFERFPGVTPGPAPHVLPWTAAAPGLVRMHRTAVPWPDAPLGAPSANDYADAASGHGVTFRQVPSFSKVPAKAQDAPGDALARLHDGKLAVDDDDPARCAWFDHENGGRIVADLQKPTDVRRVATWSWHRGNRAPQRYVLFGSAAAEQPDGAGRDPATAGWTRVGEVDTRPLGNGRKHVVSIARPDGATLGTFRWLLFQVRQVGGNGTFFSEIDVHAHGEPGAAPPPPPPPRATAITLSPTAGVELLRLADGLFARIEPSTDRVRFAVAVASLPATAATPLPAPDAPEPLEPLTRGGPGRYPQVVTTHGTLGTGDAPYVVDTLTVPETNPFHSWMRCAAFDFFADGERAAVSTWSGDVWVVSGIDDDLDVLQWRRFATGLFDPLGLRIVGDVVHTLGRDGITRLHDRDQDGEADFYERFNNDLLVTKNFHEYAFDLQTDADGNFYFSKAGPVRPGGRGFDKIVPHHGTIMKVAKDGSRLDVVVTGARAPNGIGVGPNGELTSGDNQGTWMPVCRLNWSPNGTFWGCVDTAHRDPKPAAYDPPLCWLPMNVDNSGGGQTWVTSDRFGPLRGELLHLSYGTCSLFLVLKEQVHGVTQGGVVRFPLEFASSLMRGRFHPTDGQLYVVGFKGWQTSAARDTAFQRVRYRGGAVHMPRALHVTKRGIRVEFTDPLDPASASDKDAYVLERWNYVWSNRYGSPEISLVKPPPPEQLKGLNESFTQRDPIAIRSARLEPDGRTVFLEVDDLKPVMQMRLRIDVRAKGGARVLRDVHTTVHALGDDRDAR